MMRPTFLGFEASKSALYAAQKSMDITGNNLSNITTVGYSRQRVDQTANSAGGYPSRYKINQSVYAGMGVNVNGVAQMRSVQLDQAFRNQYGTSGYYGKTSGMLGQVEKILQELDENGESIADLGNGYGFKYGISEIYSALQDFSKSANNPAQAQIVSQSFSNICNILNEKYKQLEGLKDTFEFEFSAQVDRTNVIFKEIADLNKKIENSILANQYEGQFGPNELKDARNLLIDELSKYGAVKVTYVDRPSDPEKGTIGGVVIDFNGKTAVDGGDYERIMLTKVNGVSQLNWRSDGKEVDPGKGELKGYLDILNGTGPNPINEIDTRQRGFPYYMSKLDALAQTLANTFNNCVPQVDDTTVPPTDKVDADGNIVYRNFFGEAQPDGTVLVFEKVSAKNISISNALKTDSTYLIYDKNSTNNETVMGMIDQLINKKHTFDTPSDDFYGTFEDYINDYNVTLADDIMYSNDSYDASLIITQEILNSRDSVMGVSETEETTNMMIFNRSFQAAARMMNTMDGLIDIIVNQLGKY